ncbi:plasmid mobilization protein [Paenirhodobacter populi]|uniref:plasmid mobilization protein n=1 Tax=Paenirhodobacter populi TaxID=2306993 RepID=UPI000FE35F2A|nr:plasmid mobilization relaxosome protein MobC [Sinirhodobacter populi]RWR05002.1 plasmid mobilization relaxosome protein MobC [Sinirhodobacter populi]
MARPERTKRTQRFEVALNDKERAEIEKRADAVGLPASAYMRSVALGSEPPIRPNRIDAEAVAALNRIGSNINQIAKVGNTSKTLTPDQVKALIATHKGLAQIAGRINSAVTA